MSPDQEITLAVDDKGCVVGIMYANDDVAMMKRECARLRLENQALKTALEEGRTDFEFYLKRDRPVTAQLAIKRIDLALGKDGGT